MSNITPDELKRIFPGASQSTIRRNQAGGVASSAVVEPNPGVQSVAEDAGKAADPVRRLVRYTLFRVRAVDQENWCTKHFTDSLVLAGILSDDSPKYCQIEVAQVAVKFPSEERTEIEISEL